MTRNVREVLANGRGASNAAPAGEREDPILDRCPYSAARFALRERRPRGPRASPRSVIQSPPSSGAPVTLPPMIVRQPPSSVMISPASFTTSTLSPLKPGGPTKSQCSGVPLLSPWSVMLNPAAASAGVCCSDVLLPVNVSTSS